MFAMRNESSDSGFPSLSEVADTIRTQDRGLNEGNTVINESIGQVSEATIVPSGTPDATSAPGNACTPNEVGHESVIKEILASYANKLSPTSLNKANLRNAQ
ncbi:hypothetical protein Tco_0732773 [Tanacetum coccineum]